MSAPNRGSRPGKGFAVAFVGLVATWALAFPAAGPSLVLAPAGAAPLVSGADTPRVEAPMPTGIVASGSGSADVEGVASPPIDVSAGCPEGYTDLGRFKLTAYVLAVESEFAAERTVRDPCGLKGVYRTDFLFSTKANPGGVMMQGSGRTVDGRIVHYTQIEGRHCFEELECPKTKSGTCAEAGRTVAVDRRMIPLGAELLVEGLGPRTAEDTGSLVRGRHLDVYLGDELSLAAAQRETRLGRRVCYRR